MRSRLKEVLKKCESDHVPNLSHKELFLATTDILPVADDKKTWGSWTFVGFWVADCFNLNTFLIASSMITAGLNWWQSLLCVIVGYTMVGPFIVLNARPRAVHGLVFPSVCRTTFGVFGTFWPIFTRASIACYGHVDRLHNFPCNLLALSLPTIWVPIHKLRWLLFAKAIVGPMAGLTLLGWSVQRAGGAGPIFSQPATLHGSKLAWQMVTSIGDCFGNLVTLIVNAPDFASRAKTPSASVWSQLITMPLGFSITSFLGIVICSASAVQYGQPIWNVVKIMETMLNGADSKTRAGLAFIAMGFIYVTYITIRRGGYIAAIVGICINPWLLYKSPQTLTKFLAANGIFLACIAGPMISDYWFVRRGHMRINDLYVADKKGWYWYTRGINRRGYLAMSCGFAINLPGFIGTLQPSIKLSSGAMRIYYMMWLTGPGVSGLAYYLFCLISPPQGMNRHFEEIDESSGEPRIDHRITNMAQTQNNQETTVLNVIDTNSEIEGGRTDGDDGDREVSPNEGSALRQRVNTDTNTNTPAPQV
ncbi:hypothetical protein I302_107865 [Kwoniella bestiolae CBS 10118]|uniref:Uracil permease n=1 Tax=Kwoniella bestiolae CBS 10118 TaxID=1296100 RepID=A0AAJ8KEJ9_9TREE